MSAEALAVMEERRAARENEELRQRLLLIDLEAEYNRYGMIVLPNGWVFSHVPTIREYEQASLWRCPPEEQEKLLREAQQEKTRRWLRLDELDEKNRRANEAAREKWKTR